MADLLKVMEREQLCSEHAAQCFLEAGRRMRAAAKRCQHGILLPHECKECEAEATPEEISEFMAAEGLAPNAEGQRGGAA